MHYQDILDFWFPELDLRESNKRWFGKNEEFDAEIRRRFASTLERARRGELTEWRSQAPSALAYIIVLDQFSRNLYRNSPEAFASDTVALESAHAALEAGFDMQLSLIQRAFLYLPFEHSEHIADQERSVELYLALEAEAAESQRSVFTSYVDYARAHHKIIARFGRFPHRNAVLERESSPEEIAFLQEPGSRF